MEELTAEQKVFRRKWVVLISAGESALESAIKLAAAYFTGSVGLLADCIHSGVDVAGSIMVWIGVRVAPQKTKRFPFGLYKIENLMALVIGFAILYGAYEILQIFFGGETELPQNIPLGMSAVLLGMALDFFWGRFEAKSGRLLNSPGIEASGNHTLTDVYSSSLVLVGLAGAWFGYNLDRWAALFIALFVAKIGLEILWDNLKTLLDISLPPQRLAEFSALAAATEGVREVKGIRGRDAGSFRFLYVDIGVKAFQLDEAHRIADRVEAALKERDPAIDSVFVSFDHALPQQVRLAAPTDATGRTLSPHFGKATHLTVIEYDRLARKVVAQETVPNPYVEDEKHRGIHLAERIMEKGVDSVCCREDVRDKGPGLMLRRFGIDVRATGADDLPTLLEDYFHRSTSVY
ncbi:MAG: cation diffusion facilitator family transporter [Nitrospinae bacterium]|nr:cation diffusion facilitator family transporter [Nitrospinota bacterium]